MSIQTELTRITNAKAAIKTAIEGKGVTVPDGTLLDGMAALIESIETGSISNNIVAGSFTLTESLTTSSPLYIDIAFPKNEFPLMYCVYEDTSNLLYGDTSHTVTRIRYLISSRTQNSFSDIGYYAISSYNAAGKYEMKFVDSRIYRSDTNKGYANSAGVYGSMDVSLNDNQIRFNGPSEGAWYLVGRTYNYILYWGD